ncbi:hypothetical protein [Pseudoalteromonas luteoviolacea]|uniref:Uncharacterized protein n=1 Tax=Pseudoalteromonas luteoviolacea DSM 6061 TaxID=1365250 RepID=A0A166WC46_9GAMM|nr:hypothetical protein [Pseudoalteromonas luteoviolacea]KZN37127.1 hypothetical protein N475_17065 [Pseudoalteromonas luteoviolacea DSM 6061]KZN52813.1 hypothetical protein N474_22325 [Pseudoalteromonas luteoviolacea CPMOR-2]MBE0389515.1 hypothetical protein [Pseudoalteromonas luteoviolacea DSM 6061]TQF67841.1 hypothetical protein FLM44_21925 [Pseudoalteromonas luteoviolacea]
MNVNNLPAGYTGYNSLLKSKEEEVDQSQTSHTTDPQKVEAEKANAENKEDTKSENVQTKDKRVQSILSLQQQIKSLQLESGELNDEKRTKLDELKNNLEKELSEVQSLIRNQASTYVSGLFSNSPNQGSTHSGMFLSSKA